MNVNLLKTRLVGEFRANPVKTGLLAILLVFGGYMYLPPLVGVVLGDSDDSEAPQAAPTTPNALVRVATSAATPASPRVRLHWRETAAAIASDPLMESETAWTSRPSPFVTPAPVVKPPPPLPVTEPTPATQITPVDAGLVLTSTITGGRQAVALINGDAYRPGDAVTAETGCTYQIVEVAADRVTLERDGKRYVLEIALADASRSETARHDAEASTNGFESEESAATTDGINSTEVP